MFIYSAHSPAVGYNYHPCLLLSFHLSLFLSLVHTVVYALSLVHSLFRSPLHTHTHSLSYTLSLMHSLLPSCTLSPVHTHTLSLMHHLSCILPNPPSHAHTLSCTHFPLLSPPFHTRGGGGMRRCVCVYAKQTDSLYFHEWDFFSLDVGRFPISSRLISIRISARPQNITVVQVYVPVSDHEDKEIEQFYEQLDSIVAKTSKKDIFVVQRRQECQSSPGAQQHWAGTVGRFGIRETNDRGSRLLELAKSRRLTFANTLHPHKLSRTATWHVPNGQIHNQIDIILTPQCFKCSASTRQT